MDNSDSKDKDFYYVLLVNFESSWPVIFLVNRMHYKLCMLMLHAGGMAFASPNNGNHTCERHDYDQLECNYNINMVAYNTTQIEGFTLKIQNLQWQPNRS